MTPLEERDRALLALALECGLTAAQVARLDVESVDAQADVVRLERRGGGLREVSAAPGSLRPVERYLERARGVLSAPEGPPTAALLLSKTGRRMTGSDVRRRLAALGHLRVSGPHPSTRLYTRIESARVRAAYLRAHPRA